VVALIMSRIGHEHARFAAGLREDFGDDLEIQFQRIREAEASASPAC